MLEFGHAIVMPFRIDMPQKIFPRINRIARMTAPCGQRTCFRASEDISDGSIVQRHGPHEQLILKLFLFVFSVDLNIFSEHSLQQIFYALDKTVRTSITY